MSTTLRPALEASRLLTGQEPPRERRETDLYYGQGRPDAGWTADRDWVLSDVKEMEGYLSWIRRDAEGGGHISRFEARKLLEVAQKLNAYLDKFDPPEAAAGPSSGDAGIPPTSRQAQATMGAKPGSMRLWTQEGPGGFVHPWPLDPPMSVPDWVAQREREKGWEVLSAALVDYLGHEVKKWNKAELHGGRVGLVEPRRDISQDSNDRGDGLGFTETR